MTRFQVILIAAMLFILVSYFRRFRRPVIDKIFISLLMLAGVFFVLYPDTTNRLAHFLGIGRGADLVFYLAMLGFGYLSFVLYSKIRKLEDQLASIIRKQSLESINPAKKDA